MEFWGYVVAVLFVVGIAWKAYLNYHNANAGRYLNDMNERDKRR